jgi:acyl dehydratase
MHRNWKSVFEGQSLPPVVAAPLELAQIVRYQGASGDLNPLHYDHDYARAAGFDGAFSVGMLQAGVLAAQVVGWFGAESVRRFAVRFREPAWPGDVLTYAATIVAKREVDGERRVELELEVTRQTGGVHLRGIAECALT